MKKISFTAFMCLIIISTSLLAKPRQTKLFNGKNLKGWDTYFAPGATVNTSSVFSVIEKDGMKCLHISGEVNGSLATQKEYENYHVRMVFRWGEKVYTKFNSGLLYNSYGPFGAGLNVWMSAVEFQLCTGKMGDAYCMGKSSVEVTAAASADSKSYIYNNSSKPAVFGEGFPAKNCSKQTDYEKSAGEWNVIDLYCVGRTAVHVVNGKPNMVTTNIGRIEKEGKLPLSKGKIQIQSEGGELYIKELTLEKIDRIPYEL